MTQVGKSGSDKRRRRTTTRRAEDEPFAQVERRERVAPRKQRAVWRVGRSWFASKRRVLRFVLLLVVFMVGFNALFYLWISPGGFFHNYLKVNAEASAAVLQALGDDATATGVSVGSSRFSLSVARGCDAIQVSAFLVFAVLAWPISVPLWRRMIGLTVGTLLLLALNLVRIVSLYYTGIYFPRAFETVHIDVWQAAFVVMALFFWVVWFCWATPTMTGEGDVAP